MIKIRLQVGKDKVEGSLEGVKKAQGWLTWWILVLLIVEGDFCDRPIGRRTDW